MDQIKIGNYIRAKRKEMNLTQEQLAEKLNVTNKSISRWENGRTFPDLSLYQPLCNVLDISISELLNGEDIDPNVLKNETNKLILRLLYTKKQLFVLKFFLSLIFGIGIGLIAYTLSFVETLDSLQQIGFIGSGIVLMMTVTLVRILIIDKLSIK